MSLKVGDSIPKFELLNQHGEPFDSGTVIGKKPVVVYFYPKDQTPGCTAEACSFRDRYEEFLELGAEVIGIIQMELKVTRNLQKGITFLLFC